MDCPKGLEGAKHMDALALKKSSYRLVQAAWQYPRKQYKFYVRLVLKVMISTIVSTYTEVRKA